MSAARGGVWGWLVAAGKAATVVTSNGLKWLRIQRRLYKNKIKESCGYNLPRLPQDSQSKGCTGWGGETKEAVPQSAVLAG